MTVRQLPGWAFRSPTDYANAMDQIHAAYDPVLGAGLVNVLERLQVFQVFSSAWFSLALAVLLISIVACTIDRMPRLWRQVRDVRVVQPDAFFDLELPDRAALTGVTPVDAATVLRRRGFGVSEVADGGATYLYGDRHRYTKLATLLTHAGLILFLVAAAVTSRLGFEAGLVVAEGESTTVQPIGTPGLLLVKNNGFEAPGLSTGTPTDFRTDLSVYQDGVEVARQTVRVNEPLAAAGFTFHQNGYGPAPDLLIRDVAGRPLWSGPVPLVEAALERPYAQLGVPGRDVGLQLLLERAPDGQAVVLVLPYRVAGAAADGSPDIQELVPMAIAVGETQTAPGIDFSVQLRDVGEYTLLIAKRDPGQGLVWLAFLLLIVGLVITFYLPRRRVWARVSGDGRLTAVFRADRYVDVEREFGGLLDDLVAARRSGTPGLAAVEPSAGGPGTPGSSADEPATGGPPGTRVDPAPGPGSGRSGR
jgi:cytochrome c biogenesis protein